MSDEAKLKSDPVTANDNTGADDTPAKADAPQSHDLLTDLIMALRLYSRLPTGSSAHLAPNISRFALALPFASVIIGLVPSLILFLGYLLGLPPLYVTFLAVAGAIIVTGAMAEDAAGDSADGLVGGQTPTRRLEILKDSRLGTYGVTAIVLLIGLRVSVIVALFAQGVHLAILLWLAASILARSAAIWLTRSLPPARTDGASAASGRVSKKSFWIGSVFAALLAFVMAAPWVGVLGLVVSFGAIVVVTWGWGKICDRLVGGQTGDLIGALQAALEITALSAFIIFVGA